MSQSNLQLFLKNHAVKKTAKKDKEFVYTHTSLGDGGKPMKIYPGSYNIRDDEFDEFYKEYFNQVWQVGFRIKEPIQSLDCLNKEHLLNYPSTGGYAILEDSFTGPECPVDILSPLSKTVLGYFYGIHLH